MRSKLRRNNFLCNFLKGGTDVYLLYTVHRMNMFYGIAKFLTLDRTRQKPCAEIEWIFRTTVPFKKVRCVVSFSN